MKTLITKGTTPGNGTNGSNPLPASVVESVANRPSGTTAASERTRVMLEFQRTSLEMSRQFLETQKNVMLAYLAGGAPRVDIAAEHQFQPQGAITTTPPLENRTPFQGGLREPASPVEVQRPQASDGAAAHETTPSRDSMDHQTLSDNTHDLHGSTGSIQSIIEQTVPPQAIETTELAPRELSSEDLVVSLIEIVSERTGYPPEMLEPTLDLEADLGIDSIKRVEILNSFRKLLPESSQQSLEGGIEQLASVKSLQGIIDWIRTERLSSGAPPEASTK